MYKQPKLINHRHCGPAGEAWLQTAGDCFVPRNDVYIEISQTNPKANKASSLRTLFQGEAIHVNLRDHCRSKRAALCFAVAVVNGFYSKMFSIKIIQVVQYKYPKSC